ncbi:MAG: PAS domain S-box protein [Clostridia bacterium]|nr:PAS domain S-box protein [Clostridia bacterium]
MLPDVSIYKLSHLPYQITTDNIVMDMGYAFTTLTGYMNSDVIKKDISWILKRLLKSKYDINENEIGNEEKVFFIFTKSLEAREVQISVQYTQNAAAKIFIFREILDSRLEDKLVFVNELFNDNTIGCAVFSVPDLLLLKANQLYLDFLDSPFNEVKNSIGKPIQEIMSGFEGSQAEIIWRTVLDTKKTSYVKENRYNKFERGITYWDSIQTPIFIKGDLKYIYEIATDVTERVLNRKQIEKQSSLIKQQNELLSRQASLLDLSNEAIIAWRLDGSIIYWNKGAEKKYGYSGEEAIGANIHRLLRTIHPCSFDDFMSKLTEARVWNGEIVHTTKSGQKLIFETKQQIIIDNFGDKLVLESNRDITKRKQAEEKTVWNKTRAEILSEVAAKLLSNDQPMDIVEELCTEVMKFLDCQVFLNYLVDDEKQLLHLNAYKGIPENVAREMEWLEYGTVVCSCIAKDRDGIVAENVQGIRNTGINLIKSMGLKAGACYPLMEQQKVIGTLSFGTKARDSFNEDELSVIKAIANQVAVAMNRVKTEQIFCEYHKTTSFTE